MMEYFIPNPFFPTREIRYAVPTESLTGDPMGSKRFVFFTGDTTGDCEEVMIP